MVSPRVILWAAGLAAAAGLVLAGLGLVRREAAARPEYTVLPVVTQVEAAPAWLGPGAAGLVREVEAAFAGPFQVLDPEPVLAALARLQAAGRIRSARAERVLPSQVRLVLQVPRPVAWYRGADGRPRLLDAGGAVVAGPVLEPAVLPELRWVGIEPPPAPAADLRNGAAVAWEVQDRFLAALGPGFRLAAVDLGNLEYRLLADGTRAEVRLEVEAAGGHRVLLEWDRRPESPFPPLDMEIKLATAREILKKYPAFQGLIAADLRMEHRWEKWITPAPGDPAAAGR